MLELSWAPNPITGAAAVFLWGARQTGKTTFLHDRYSDARFYDLLDTTLSAELSVRPKILREEVLAERPSIVVIDEVQHVPPLLEEVHWLLENTATRFILCGSGARKLRRRSRNLLGGRAIDYHLLPLTAHEIGDVDLARVLQYGALPVHCLANDPSPLLKAYVHNNIKVEIIDESATRNIPAFSRFLAIAGLCHGQQLNYANAARETGVSASTVQLHPEAQRIAEGSDLLGRALSEENAPRRKVIVCRLERRRTTDDGIELLPWRSFCREMWDGKLI